tara:strand:- start:663 stop:950 length:288 start_codon:yes stop_codon:yes gene_type:complete
MSQPTDTPSMPMTTARKMELFDHLLYYLYHDCHVYAQADKHSPFYESMTDEIGPVSDNDLESLSQMAEALADYIQDIHPSLLLMTMTPAKHRRVF